MISGMELQVVFGIVFTIFRRSLNKPDWTIRIKMAFPSSLHTTLITKFRGYLQHPQTERWVPNINGLEPLSTKATQSILIF